MIFIK